MRNLSHAILLSLVLACSQAPETILIEAQSLELRLDRTGEDPDSAGSPSLEPAIVQRWEGPDLLDAWVPRKGEGTAIKTRVDYRFDGHGSIELTQIPDQPFDHIYIDMRRPKDGQLMLELWDKDDNKLHGAAIYFRNSAPSLRDNHTFPLQRIRKKLEQVAKITFRFPKELSLVKVQRIAFLRNHPLAWVPRGDNPSMHAFGTRKRFAHGFSSDQTLSAQFSPHPGALFSFSCGAPAGLEAEGELRLRLGFLTLDGKNVFSRGFDVPVDGWLAHQITLPPELAEHESLTAQFSLTPGNNPQGGTSNLTACALTPPRVDGWQETPRTVLLLTSDTHRGDHLGFLEGNIDVLTPTLDRLAGEGTAFTQCWAASNVTNPTHISLMTGAGVHDHGVTSNDLPVSPKLTTLAEIFASHGYRTYSSVSAAHLGWSGLDRGFERMASPDRAQQDSSETIAILEEWLEEDVTEGRPLFAWLHLFDAHGSYKPPAPYNTQYWDKSKSPTDPAMKSTYPDVDWPTWANGVTDPSYVESLYRGEVTYQDHALRDLLARHPRLGDDLLVFVGDHGENLVDQRPNFDHTSLTTATQHIPLILAGSRVPNQGLVHHPVAQIDVGRTLLDLAGLGGDEFPGQNLLRLPPEEDPQSPVSLFGLQAHAQSASVRRGRWFLHHGLYGQGRTNHVRITEHTVSLFDTESDPDCQTDVSAEHHDLAVELRAELIAWLATSRIAEFLTNDRMTDAATLKALASLGYAAGSALPEDNPWIDPDCDCETCSRFSSDPSPGPPSKE